MYEYLDVCFSVWHLDAYTQRRIVISTRIGKRVVMIMSTFDQEKIFCPCRVDDFNRGE